MRDTRSAGDALYRIGRARFREFVVECVRLCLTGHDPEDAACAAVAAVFHAYVNREAQMRKARSLLADPKIAAAIASRLPADFG